VGLLFPSRIIFQRRKGKKKKFQFAEMLPQQMIRSLVKRNRIRSDSSPGGLHSCCSCCFDSGHAGPDEMRVREFFSRLLFSMSGFWFFIILCVSLIQLA
jgi:hypothetical protein